VIDAHPMLDDNVRAGTAGGSQQALDGVD